MRNNITSLSILILLWLILPQGPACAEGPTDYVAYWKLDETSGSLAADASGNGINATLQGNASWLPSGGRVDGALSLDGSDDYALSSDHSMLDSAHLTVAAWIYHDTNQDGWRVIATRQMGTGNAEHYFLGLCNNELRWMVRTENGVSGHTTAMPTIFPGQWVHLAGTFDGQAVRGYVNGVEVFSYAHSGSIAADSNGICIGAGNNSGTWVEFFDGRIDDLRIYNYALTAAEIAALTPVVVNDRIRPWAANTRYWQYKGEPVLLLGGSKQDNLFQIPDLEEHLDLLASVGGNYIRNTMSDREEGNVYPYRQLPSGLYDLDQWEDEYWERFDTMLRLTNERNIIVQIEVWDRWDFADGHWLGIESWGPHPYRPANNVNYTEEETGLAESYPNMNLHPFFFTVPGMENYEPRYDLLRGYQERFVAKMLSYSLPYGNVLYCMNNETPAEVAWGQYWMAFIKSQAEQAGVDVCVTDMFIDVYDPENSDKLKVMLDNPQLYDFLDVSQVNNRNFGDTHWNRLHWIVEQVNVHPRPINHTKIYSDGAPDIWWAGTPQDGIERFWRNILCGSASSRFHRPPAAGIGLNETAQACIRAARKAEGLVRFWDLKPHMELISDRSENEAYLAASPGEAYVLFFSLGGSVQLNMADVAGSMTLTWINISSGEFGGSSDVAGGGVTTITAPSASPWVAVIINCYGDVSENGSLSAYDASLAAQYAVGLITLTANQITKADVTGNGSVSATDASWIARKAVDASVVFPVE
ncbi:LamG-like jellyroll fold domain-containing protein [Candidatus Omnitrophota bacterium]